MLSLSRPLSVTRAILALSLVSLLVMMGSSMATPSLALYAGNYPGSNELLIGAVIAGFAVGRLLFDIPSGFLADRLGMSRTMALGLGILVGSSLVAALAPNYWALLSARLIEGIGSAIYVSAAIAFVLIASDPSKRGATMGTYQSILMTGPIVGPIAGAPAAAYFGLNAPYFAFAAMMAGALAFVAYLGYKGTFALRKPAVERAGDSGLAGHGPRAISLYINSAGIATFGFAFLRSGVYSTGLPLFAYGSLSLSIFEVGVILTAASFANLVSSYFSGRITMRFGMRKTLFAAIMFSSALVLLIPLASSTVQLLAVMMLLGVSSGFFGQSIAWAAEQIENKVRTSMATNTSASFQKTIAMQSHVTRGIGINRMIGDFGLILGPLFVGYLVSLFNSSPAVWFASFGATAIILAVASLSILRYSAAPRPAASQLNAEATKL